MLQAATSVLRGRPRGLLRGTTSPRRKSSPPQTPQGSRRSCAPERQVFRAGQPQQSALASSTSSGDSARNSSGSSVHGRSPVLHATGIAAWLGAALTAAWLGAALTAAWLGAALTAAWLGAGAADAPADTPDLPGSGADSDSTPAGPAATAVVPGRYIGPSPFVLVILLECGLSLVRQTVGPACHRHCMTKAADPVRVRGLQRIQAGLARPDPRRLDANPSRYRQGRRRGWRAGTSCGCPAGWTKTSGQASGAATA